MVNAIDKLSLAEVTRAYNKLARKWDDVPYVRKFSSLGVARRQLKKTLKYTGENVIVILRKVDKRGKGANRFPFYKNGLLVSQYVDKCTENGHKATEARRDVRYDTRQGYIALV